MNFLNTDWAVVIATFFSPIIAVLITLWSQRREATQRLRMDVFATMMRLRRQPLDREFVGSLNMVPVCFYKNKKVMAEYSLLTSAFESPFWNSPDVDARSRQVEQMRQRLAYLLSEMAAALHIRVDQLQIHSGGYAPIGWTDESNANAEARQAIVDALSGRKPPIVLVQNIPLPPDADNNDNAGTSDRQG